MRSFFLMICWLALGADYSRAQHLSGTEPLTEKGDFAKGMLEGLDRWLDRETAIAATTRHRFTKIDLTSPETYRDSLKPKRDRLKTILGVIDARVPRVTLELIGATDRPALLAQTNAFKAFAIRWPVLPGVTGEGVLLEPIAPAKANVVALPDVNMSPEQLAGLSPGLAPSSQFARRLAESGCRVVIPVLVDRDDKWSGNPIIGKMTNQSHREFVHRMAYQMGRTLVGYELQRVFAVIDHFTANHPKLPIGVYGHGEGGTLALFAAASDERIAAATLSGSFGPREAMHDEPLDHDIWNRLREFGDGELLQMILPRAVAVEHCFGPAIDPPAARPGRAGGAPGRVVFPSPRDGAAEVARAMREFPGRTLFPNAAPVSRNEQLTPTVMAVKQRLGLGACVEPFLEALGLKAAADIATPVEPILVDGEARHKRQFDELVIFTQSLLPEAARKRNDHVWSKLSKKSIDSLVTSQRPIRESFWSDIVGKMPEPTAKMRPRTRLLLETPKWKGYEVVLDVFDDVISYGILLVPNDIKPGERRPCVVCQHGLEGRPMDVVDPTQTTRAYNSYGARLADQGFVVFAPQAPYIFRNQFRQVVRKMHPLGYNIYAVIVRQHQQILNFLGTLDFVDSSRIALYGLSYGGKVAMRIPAILLGYCAVICSGDFNEWIWKNITLDWQNSYMFTGEYEMYEFNLGNTFNYAEMAALIAPRPFMVERGHDDGVGLDEYVAFEFAKVRRFYSRLRIANRTEIEFFAGGHEIHGVGSFAFLRRHLDWPRRD